MTKTIRGGLKRDDRAEQDVKWFFVELAGSADHASPDRRDEARAIEQTLRSLPAYHRGALALWYRKKACPPAVEHALGVTTSLAIRLDCVDHPAIGVSTEAHEEAAAARLLARITRGTPGDKRVLRQLALKARRHFRRAIRAFADAHGQEAE